MKRRKERKGKLIEKRMDELHLLWANCYYEWYWTRKLFYWHKNSF